MPKRGQASVEVQSVGFWWWWGAQTVAIRVTEAHFTGVDNVKPHIPTRHQ